MENKGLFIVAIIAVAAVGAAGTYYYLTEPGWFDGPTGEDGDDGDDGDDGLDFDSIPNVYYCDTRAEIDSALTAIGTGKGEIIITAAISLTSEITLDGGGIYKIRGLGAGNLSPQGTIHAISIEDVDSCLITDLRIDMSDSTANTANGINVEDVSDNPVTIDNVQIIGDGDPFGRGIMVMSNNVIVRGCYMEDIYAGIFGTGHSFCSFENNIIKNMTYIGIRINGESNTAEGNVIGYCEFGLYISGLNHNSIAGNTITYFLSAGIVVWDSDSNSIMGNSVDQDDSVYSGDDIYGLHLYSGSSNNVIDGNTICDVINDGAGEGIGIYVENSNPDNIISNNNIKGCTTGLDIDDVTCINDNNVVSP